ncbi:MAG: hypothetical protein ACREV0_00145 [Burkholderiales bacterium]
MRKARVKPQFGCAVFAASAAGKVFNIAMTAAAARLARGLSWFMAAIVKARIRAAVTQK